MTTAYITHAECLRHEMGAGHPENPDRLNSVNEHIRVHRAAYVDLIFEHAPKEGYVQLDPDTAMNPSSLGAARRAAGAGVLAVDEVMAGRSQNAFCAVRPCGHHATPSRSMGFCIFNNVAVAAAYALEVKGLERVAIVDFDVHHGNGTEDMFSVPEWRKRVVMAGFFQHPFYPGSGADSPAPNMFNVPLPAGSDGVAARRALKETWLPALDEFKPQMILISAGFDAHREDLLGGLALVEADYEWMTRELMSLAERHSEKRIVSMLEGGYHLGALGRSAAAHVRTLAGH
jgi:acetoin utilization deacetylase AcuC-like enzyme